MGDEKSFVSYEKAEKMLPDGDTVHTFRNPNGAMLIGADWDREDLLKALKSADNIKETGPMAQKMNHGLVIIHKGSLLFIETENKSLQSKPS